MLAYVSENTGEKVDVSTTYKITDPLISEVRALLFLLAFLSFERVGIAFVVFYKQRLRT